jgi:hypothetical protein
VKPGDRIAAILDALDRLSPGARGALIVVSPLLLLAALVAAFAIAPHGRGGGAPPPHSSTTDHPRTQPTLIPPSRPAPATASTEPALSAATGPALRFLRDYLAYSYGRVSLTAIRNADPGLIASLRRAHPRVPPAARKRRPRVTTLQVLSQAPSAAQATATISDGSGPQYPLIFYLDRRPGGWVVTRLGDD